LELFPEKGAGVGVGVVVAEQPSTVGLALEPRHEHLDTSKQAVEPSLQVGECARVVPPDLVETPLELTDAFLEIVDLM
jgi:hypothetical protein